MIIPDTASHVNAAEISFRHPRDLPAPELASTISDIPSSKKMLLCNDLLDMQC